MRKRCKISNKFLFLCPRAIPLQLNDDFKYGSISNYLVDRHFIPIKLDKVHVDEIRMSLNKRQGFNTGLPINHLLLHVVGISQSCAKYVAKVNTSGLACQTLPMYVSHHKIAIHLGSFHF